MTKFLIFKKGKNNSVKFTKCLYFSFSQNHVLP